MRGFKLFKNQDGVAAVEFALIAPLLILLFFGTIELSNLLIADSKLRNTAASMSDLLTQKTNAVVSETELVDIALLAATQIMLPLPVAGPKLAILMTVHRPTSYTTAEIVWSRIIVGGATASQLTPALGLVVPDCADPSTLPATLLPKAPTGSNPAPPFNDVLEVSAVYEFTPWFATIFNTSVLLRSTNYNMPRYSLVLNAGAGISASPCN